MKDSVSILMPTYNHEQYVGEAISSVISQNFNGKIEVHVFDDCSTDKTAEIVSEYVKKYPDIVTLYRNPKNLGSGLASFAYHKVAINTEFWCILEGDDFWVSDTSLQERKDVLSSHEKLVGCAGNTRVIKKGKEGEIITTYFETFSLADCLSFSKSHSFYLHTSSFLWRNIFPKNIPPFPPGFYKIKGDPALMHMMMGNGFAIHRLNKIVSAYRITGEGRWSKLSEKEQQKLNDAYIRKMRSFWPLKHKVLYFLSFSEYSNDFTRKISNQLTKMGILPKPINTL